MQLVPFRDINGRIIPRNWHPVYGEKHTRAAGGTCKASLVFCPESQCLKSINHCPKCLFFVSAERYKGVKCKSKGEQKTPQCYAENKFKETPKQKN